MLTLSEIRGRYRDDILAIAARRGVDRVRIFGSVARGEAGPESDIDFLVHVQKGVSLLDLAALDRELSSLLGARVDIVDDAFVDDDIKSFVLKEATPL